jgi:hypothetical protein
MKGSDFRKGSSNQSSQHIRGCYSSSFMILTIACCLNGSDPGSPFHHARHMHPNDDAPSRLSAASRLLHPASFNIKRSQPLELYGHCCKFTFHHDPATDIFRMSSSQPFVSSPGSLKGTSHGRKSRFTFKHLSLLNQSSATCPLRVIAHIDLDVNFRCPLICGMRRL